MVKRVKRFEIAADNHPFVGRIFDLSIIHLHDFESPEDALHYPDVSYALSVIERTNLIVDRLDSLNCIGDLLWSRSPIKAATLPISTYDFCNLIHDAFLMRTISILDCFCLLAVDVLELEIKPRQANIERIRSTTNNHPCCDRLQILSDIQFELRTERNFRFHSGIQRSLTDDDQIFRTFARIEKFSKRNVTATNTDGSVTSSRELYKEAIGNLREQFNANVKNLSTALNPIYDSMHDEFEKRFSEKFNCEAGYGRKLFSNAV